MRAAAAQNARVKDPVYHVVLSWPEGEHPSDDEAFACASHAVSSVGMAGHQYVFAVHRNTRNVHVHIAVNRVNPQTYRAVYPDRDYFKLDRAMRELELRYGWRHDKGPLSVIERDGKMVVDWSSRVPQTQGHMPAAAADMERHADQESLFSYVRGAPRQAVMAALKDPHISWTMLHSLLAQHGLAIREKGQGLAVYACAQPDASAAECTPVKASDLHEDLSRNRLIRRLGAFQPASEAEAPARRYDRFRPPVRNAAERGARRQERTDARRALHQRYLLYLSELESPRIDAAEIRSRFIELHADARRRRALIRANVSNPAERRILYSVVAFETARERERLRERIKEERASVSMQNRSVRRTFKEWVAQQAASGDEAAISQLRGWTYAVQRGRSGFTVYSAPKYNGFRAVAPAFDGGLVTLVGTTRKVRRDGAVRYKVPGGGSFLDHGDHLEVEGQALDPGLCLASLITATRKFGISFDAVGTDAFKALANSLAAALPDEEEMMGAWDKALLDMKNVPVERQRSHPRRNRSVDTD